MGIVCVCFTGGGYEEKFWVSENNLVSN